MNLWLSFKKFLFLSCHISYRRFYTEDHYDLCSAKNVLASDTAFTGHGHEGPHNVPTSVRFPLGAGWNQEHHWPREQVSAFTGIELVTFCMPDVRACHLTTEHYRCSFFVEDICVLHSFIWMNRPYWPIGKWSSIHRPWLTKWLVRLWHNARYPSELVRLGKTYNPQE